ncbi:hypothetical protein C8T65DRAFT_746599 [Cerioporus squamosus]|nr:hypothetical protein C8T65DRAFT_746599 [Cerioporus squamosus]
MPPPFAKPHLFLSLLTSTPRTNSTRTWEVFAVEQSTLEDDRLNLIEDSVDMFYCLQSSDFLNAFLPLPPDSRRRPKPTGISFNGVVGFTSERDLAERWVAIVNNKKSLCKGYKLKVNAAIYPRRKHPIDGRPHWGRQCALIEFKKGGTENDPHSLNDILGDAQAQKPTEIRGQLVSYSAYSFARQQRTASLTFLFNGTQARVSRWEHAGMIFTEAFNYVEDPELMEDQGLDPTAVLLTKSHKWYKLMDKIALGPLKGQPEDICGDEGTTIPVPANTSSSDEPAPLGAFKYVREKFAASLQEDSPRYRVAVPTDREGRFKFFLIGTPIFEAPGMLGRGTRGYIAVDVETKRFVWLKDTWRSYYVNVQAEGTILETLHAAHVSRIPTLLCAGDLGQETQMHYHWKPDTDVQDSAEASEGSRGSKRDRSGAAKSNAGDKKARKQPRIRHLSHYRLVISEVCLPLTDFKTSRQLLQVVLDCVQVQIIHGDISLGNILILPTFVKKNGQLKVEWRGILSDWELSKLIPEDGKAHRARQPERTGTWQFMAAALLWWLWWPISVEDEMESFFYILLYAGVRFLRSTVHEPSSFLHEFFDAFRLQQQQYKCSTMKHIAMTKGILTDGPADIQFFRDMDEEPDDSDHPLNIVLSDMLPIFKARYALLQFEEKLVKWAMKVRKFQQYPDKFRDPGDPPVEPPQVVSDTAVRLATHAHFKQLLTRLLQVTNWPTNDYLGDRLMPSEATVDAVSSSTSHTHAGNTAETAVTEDDAPQTKRAKTRADELMALYVPPEDQDGAEDTNMDVEPQASSSSNWYAVSRSAGRGATSRGTTRKARRS